MVVSLGIVVRWCIRMCLSKLPYHAYWGMQRMFGLIRYGLGIGLAETLHLRDLS
jgi:hypothetical protein